MSSPFTRAVVASMRRLYPEILADKSFDNTGLLLEAPHFPSIHRNRNSVLLTIDLTRAVADEAIENKHSIVVAYHPIIFRGVKALTLEDTQQESLLRLAASGVSVYCPHTAVDTVQGGMADWLCDIIAGRGTKADKSKTELSGADVEMVMVDEQNHPLPSYTPGDTTSGPKPDSQKQQQHLYIRSSTDSLPTYEKATFSNPHSPAAKPPFGPVLEHTRKVITPSSPSVLESLNASGFIRHTPQNTGSGRLITFTHPQPLTKLLSRISTHPSLPGTFPAAIPQTKTLTEIHIKTVGICPGSGAGVIKACQPYPPDLVFTGEMSHHETLAVIERGGCVVSLFHSNSERGYLQEVMREKLWYEVKKQWDLIRVKEKIGGDERNKEVEVVTANGILRQPRQRLDADTFVRLAVDVGVAVRVDIAGPEELDSRFDRGGQPQNEQDEGADEDSAGHETTIAHEEKYDEEEQYRQAANDDGERKKPAKCLWLANDQFLDDSTASWCW